MTAAENRSARLVEWSRVVKHLDNLRRLRVDAQRAGQRAKTLDVLDSVIAVDVTRADELWFQIAPEASTTEQRGSKRS